MEAASPLTPQFPLLALRLIATLVAHGRRLAATRGAASASHGTVYADADDLDAAAAAITGVWAPCPQPARARTAESRCRPAQGMARVPAALLPEYPPRRVARCHCAELQPGGRGTRVGQWREGRRCAGRGVRERAARAPRGAVCGVRAGARARAGAGAPRRRHAARRAVRCSGLRLPRALGGADGCGEAARPAPHRARRRGRRACVVRRASSLITPAG